MPACRRRSTASASPARPLPKSQRAREPAPMEICFIGLGKMGFPMARRLIEAGHTLVAYDARREAVDKLVTLGAKPATSPKDVADKVETVMASLPSLDISLAVATAKDG